MKRFNYHILSRYRTLLMGIAMLSIMCMHYFEDLTIYFPSSTIQYVIGRSVLDVVSTFGVEIFLFLSGIGLFYSWHKHPGFLSFYKKRFTRVLIPYLVVGIMFFLVYSYDDGVNLVKFLQGLFFVTFFSRGFHTFWYVLCIMMCYLIFPFIYIILDHSKHPLRALMAMIAVVVTLNTVLHFTFGVLFSNIEILLTRFPIFMIGAYFGHLVMKEKTVTKKEMIFYIVTAAIALSLRVVKTSSSMAYWTVYQRYLAALLTIPTCLLLCYGLQFANTKLMQFFNFFGKHSMEIFLFHMMYRYFFRVSDYKTVIPINEFMMLALTVLSALLFSYFYNKPQKRPVTYRYSHS